MPKYHQPLDLGEFPFNNYQQEKIYSSAMNTLGKDFKDFIFSKGLILKHILVLWRPAGGELIVHSDGEHYNPSWARLNYIHGGPGTVSWWRANDPAYVPATEGKYPSKPWPMDKIHKVEEADLIGFNIVNVGSPHGLTNVKANRWAVSLQLDHYSGLRTSFDDLCNIFADYKRKN